MSATQSIPNYQGGYKALQAIAAQDKKTRFLPGKPHDGMLGTFISCLEPAPHGFSALVATALKIAGLCLSHFSFNTFVSLYHAVHHTIKVRSANAYFESKQNVPKPGPGIVIELKSRTQTYTHTHEFVIHNDAVWTRKRGSQEEWGLVYFDGITPVEISSDGANLGVLDQARRVHYKKIIKEFRGDKLTPDQRETVTQPDFAIARDKSTKINWKQSWFTHPQLHHVVNLFTEKHLYLASDRRAWAFSHRGFYNDHFDDGAQLQHRTGSCTTLCVLEKSGKVISLHDPWSPKHAKMQIFLPDTETTSFVADNMAVSASTFMVIGYESRLGGREEALCIRTALKDLDSLGWNPMHHYGYFPDAQKPDMQVVPLESWRDHPLPLAVQEGKGFITKNITIVQTGEGNASRRLLVEGRNENGVAGYYFKNIDEKEWQFQAYSEQSLFEPTMQPLALQKECRNPFVTTVHNYTGTQVKVNAYATAKAALKRFGQGSDASILDLTIGDKTYPLRLYSKKTLWNFIGFEGDSYDLVIPQEFHEDAILRKVFDGRKVTPVLVRVDKQQVKITQAGWFATAFTFRFQR